MVGGGTLILAFSRSRFCFFIRSFLFLFFYVVNDQYDGQVFESEEKPVGHENGKFANGFIVFRFRDDSFVCLFVCD